MSAYQIVFIVICTVAVAVSGVFMYESWLDLHLGNHTDPEDRASGRISLRAGLDRVIHKSSFLALGLIWVVHGGELGLATGAALALLSLLIIVSTVLTILDLKDRRLFDVRMNLNHERDGGTSHGQVSTPSLYDDRSP
jgi:hypothetical protein